MAENVSSSTPHETPRGAATAGTSPEPERRVWTTDQLLGQEREVLIQHGDDVYRLRITRHGKLILYK
jgi:hemin uptake protein HemP